MLAIGTKVFASGSNTYVPADSCGIVVGHWLSTIDGEVSMAVPFPYYVSWHGEAPDLASEDELEVDTRP